MFVKVITLSDPIYKSLKSRLEKEKILFHYRKLALKIEVLNAHSILFESQNLFPDSSKPMKVYFALVRNQSTSPNYKLNPFCFIRALKVPKAPDPVPPGPGFNANLQQEFWRQQALLAAQQQEAQRVLLNEIRRLKQRRHHSSKKRKKCNQDSGKSNCPCSKCHKGKSIPGKDLAKCSQVDGNDDPPEEPNASTASVSANQTKGSKKMKKSNFNCKSVSRSTKCGTRSAAKLAAENVKKNCAILNPKDSLENQTMQELDSDYSPSDEDEETDQSSTESNSSEFSSEEFDTAEGEPLLHYHLSNQQLNLKSQTFHTNLQTNQQPPQPPQPPQPLPPPLPPISVPSTLQAGNDQICFVETFELDLDSKRVDNFSIPATLSQAPEDYLRFLGKCLQKKTCLAFYRLK